MTSQTQSFDDLVTSMKGKDTLSDWDVLVSYSIVQINILLAERAEQLGLHKALHWRAPDKSKYRQSTMQFVRQNTDRLQFVGPFGKIRGYYIFDVTLLKPTIAFVDTSNQITVTCGITGTMVDEETQDSMKVPSGYKCEISTSLVNVEGEWHATDGWQPSPDAATATSKPANNWITFLEKDSNKARGVCIDFTNSKITLRGSDSTSMNTMMREYLDEYFTKIAGLRYCLAAVSNHIDTSDAKSHVLKPTTFCFTVMPDVLMTWIGVQGGPANGKRPSKESTLYFAPDSRVVSPIPKNHTASVIFSHYIMMNLFIKVSFDRMMLVAASANLAALFESQLSY